MAAWPPRRAVLFRRLPLAALGPQPFGTAGFLVIPRPASCLVHSRGCLGPSPFVSNGLGAATAPHFLPFWINSTPDAPFGGLFTIL